MIEPSARIIVSTTSDMVDVVRELAAKHGIEDHVEIRVNRYVPEGKAVEPDPTLGTRWRNQGMSEEVRAPYQS